MLRAAGVTESSFSGNATVAITSIIDDLNLSDTFWPVIIRMPW